MDNGAENSGMHCSGVVFENYNAHNISLDAHAQYGVERKDIDPYKATKEGWLWINPTSAEELASSSSPSMGEANGLVQSTQ